MACYKAKFTFTFLNTFNGDCSITQGVFLNLTHIIPARGRSEFLLDFLKVTAATIVSLAPRHRLLNLPDMRCAVQRWRRFGRSVGSVHTGQAEKTPCITDACVIEVGADSAD